MATVRLVIRLIIPAVAFLLAPTALPSAVRPLAAQQSGPAPVAMHEVRLRKLHLVRPDLIPYPIDYEVVC